mmetsp:Transcript_13579/g.23117  ORF Transcript_13579/g.23117 Transcript_13579/m.23117 type:complete len:131 (+) Transcript_13579:329-721(+)
MQPIKLPRTGIEQPFLKDRPRFKEFCRDFEPISKFNTQLCEEYERMEAERPLNCANEKIVYDCIDYPSNRNEKENGPYIDENDLVELPQEDNPVDSRKYYPYGPSQGQAGLMGQKAPKLNRYYTKLKPYF